MINIIYQRFFNLKVSHNYYKDGLAQSVSVTPTSDTIKLLKGGQMLLKKLAHQSIVLYRGKPGALPNTPPDPFITLEEDFKFTFSLEIADKSTFINMTNLDTGSGSYQSSNILYFKNVPANVSIDPNAPEELEYSLLDSIRSTLFTFDFTLDPAPLIVDLIIRPINDDNTLGASFPVGKDGDGLPLLDPLTLPRDEKGIGIYGHSIDLRNKKNGRYQIQITENGNAANVLLESKIYVHNELASKPILGIIDIAYDASSALPYGDTEEYKVQFTRKKTFWKYYIVGKKSVLDFNTYSITDLGVASPDTPYVVPTLFAPLAGTEEINGQTTKVFRSNLAIDFFESPKLRIELSGDAGKRKIENLPNPSPLNAIKQNETTSELESEIYVFL